MTYFSREDYSALTEAHTVNDVQSQHDKLLTLDQALSPWLRSQNYSLHLNRTKNTAVSYQSAASTDESVLALSYFRPKDEARMVESLMGIDGTVSAGEVDSYRHPVIEIRLAPDHFAVELIVSPLAWWDQQNFMGKLAVPQHRKAFRSILRRLDDSVLFGFWHGAQLSDMHVAAWQLLRGNILDDWMSTFADGQDCLRVGMWYSLDDAALQPARIVTEAFQQVKALYELYYFMLWSSDNNFHSFYERHFRAYV